MKILMGIHWSDLDLLKHPGAWLPLLMSLAALLLLPIYPWIFAAAPELYGSESALVPLYQLLMMLPIPVSLLFSMSWLPKEPRKAVLVLALQAAAWLAAFLPILLTRI